ncbi:hypothetical protein ACTFIZ_011888 [Dictyostelium cf. discoideum]
MRDYNTIIESGEFVFKTIRRHKRPTGHPGTAQAKPLVSQSLQQQNRVAHWRDTSNLEKSLDKNDVLIKSNNTFKILTDNLGTVIYIVNIFDAELKGQYITTIRPKKLFLAFDWYKSLSDIEWAIENEGYTLIKSEIKGETLIIKTLKRVVDEYDTIIELDNYTLIGHSNNEKDHTLEEDNQEDNEKDNQEDNEEENQEENKEENHEGKKDENQNQPDGQKSSPTLPTPEKRKITIPPITSSSNDKSFMALDDMAQKIMDESLENQEELKRTEKEINTKSTSNQETKSEKPFEQPSPYTTPIKQYEKKGPTTEEKLREANDIFDFTSPNTDAIKKMEFPLSIPSNQWSFATPIVNQLNFKPTYDSPSKMIDSLSKFFNTPKKKPTNRSIKSPNKPNFYEFGQKNNKKTTMEEDIRNFNQTILKKYNKSDNPTNTPDQHNEQSKDQLEDKINNELKKVDKNLPKINL